MTTNANGQVSFAVPFTAPAGLPIITATATDPQGNTSEVSSSLPGGFQAQSAVSPHGPWSGIADLLACLWRRNRLARFGPPARPELTWDLSLSVSAGTLTLASYAGLVGSGDGTGSLFYTGPLSAINAAIEGMTYAAPAGFHGSASLNVEAQSDGITLLAGQVLISTGSFVVTTTADSGPGSLRQAILDSNAATGATNTIDFDIPGHGVQPIDLASPLPPITNPVSIDGTSEPGYAGTTLITIIADYTGTYDGLTINGSDVTVRGLTTASFGFSSSTTQSGLTIVSSPLQPGPGGSGATYQIDTIAESQLVANLHSQGLSTRLVLLDSQGRALVESDGLSSTDPDAVIDENIPAGTYFLEVQSTVAQGNFTLTTFSLPISPPLEPIPAGNGTYPPEAADFRNDGKVDLILSDYLGLQVLLGNGEGTFAPPETIVPYYQGGGGPFVAGDFNGDGEIDLVQLQLQLRRQHLRRDVTRCSWATVTAHSRLRFHTRSRPWSRDIQRPSSRAISPATASSTCHCRHQLQLRHQHSVGELIILMGNGDGSFEPGPQYDVPGSLVPYPENAGSLRGR